ncbi:MAG: sensor histidine kinase [Candidatus Thorarchaeota archaeon]
MYETALYASLVGMLVAIFFGRKAIQKRNYMDFVFTAFGLTAAIRHVNLYVWLNLLPGSELQVLLRAVDYIIGIPIMILGFEMLHASAKARVKPARRGVRLFVLLVPVLAMPVFAVFFILLDIETARLLAMLMLVPILGGTIGYYMLQFRNNPYRIAKPEFEKGTNLVILGYLTMIFATAVFVAILRLFDVGIMSEMTALLLVAAGGIVQSTVTFAGLYSKLKVGVIIVDIEGEIEIAKLMDEVETQIASTEEILTARAVMAHISHELDRVFEHGEEITMPHITLDPLDPHRMYQVDILPHELSSEGTPISAMIVINDITDSLRDIETEQLAELLHRYVKERDTAEFYLDLLNHDVSNMFQGILLGVEIALHDVEDTQKAMNTLSTVMEQINRSVDLVNHVKMMAQARTTHVQLVSVSVPAIIEESFRVVKSSAKHKAISLKFHALKESPEILAEDLLSQCFINIILFCAKMDDENDVEIEVRTEPSTEGDMLRIEIAADGLEISDEMKPSMFDWQTRSGLPSGGIGLPLARALVDRYEGKIHVEDLIPGNPSHGIRFVILLPIKK